VLGVAVALCIALWPAHEKPKIRHISATVAQTAERTEPSEPKRPPALALTPVSLDVTPPRAAPPPDEPALMSTLRTLGDSEPERSLQLAREAEQRFPGSADAAEQEWYVCKSLVNLERFYDARDEARLMVAAYPATPWAQDVARHLLVNPLDPPGDSAP
jgi:hypothetical protein